VSFDQEDTMQPADLRRPSPSPRTPPPGVADRFADPFAGGDPDAHLDATPSAPAASAPLRLAAPALLIEARFRGVTLASRLLRADAPTTFAIGDARGTDAPVNPAWLPDTGAPPGPRRHVFLEPTPGGFVLNLSAAMRPRLETELQTLAIGPDTGRAEAPLALPPGSRLHVPCGEVSFDIHPAEPAAAVPRPLLPGGWSEDAKYLLGVAIAVGLLMLAIHLVPSDPRALSLDLIDDGGRLSRAVIIPLEVNVPAVDSARALHEAGGSGSAPAAKPSGQAGDRKAPRDANRHMAFKGTARPQDARAVAAQIHDSTLLAVLDGPRSSALADVMTDGPAMGSEAENVVGNLIATNVGTGFGLGALGLTGTGPGGAGEHEGTVGGGGPHLGTTGRYGGQGGPDYGWGPGVGGLHNRHAGVPQALPGIASVRGNLDKEIIRRIVRRNINQVRYCYQNALVRRPGLEGRLVTQFTIAPTGQVLAAVVQSSTLKEVSVEACVVNAIKRWAFPGPSGGGLAMVSYPFTFAPAGGE
jgi:TonB family protein